LPQKDVQMYIFFVKVIPLFQDIFYEKVKVNLKLSLCKTSNSICYFSSNYRALLFDNSSF
jgi:hypothetical protein